MRQPRLHPIFPLEKFVEDCATALFAHSAVGAATIRQGFTASQAWNLLPAQGRQNFREHAVDPAFAAVRRAQRIAADVVARLDAVEDLAERWEREGNAEAAAALRAALSVEAPVDDYDEGEDEFDGEDEAVGDGEDEAVGDGSGLVVEVESYLRSQA